MSSSVHLLVIWAILILSEANYSSRSYKSRLGGGNSLREGGNTAACSAGMGVSNWGGIRVRGSCFTPRVVNRFIDSGIRSVSNLYSLSVKRVVKSRGSSSDSYKQERNRSARAVMSGTCTYSESSGSSFMFRSNSASPPSLSNHLNIASWIF